MKNQIILLGSFDFPRAQIVKSELSAAGIACFHEHEGSILSGVQSSVDIRINEADLEKALKIISNYKNTAEIIKERTSKLQLPLKRILVAVDFTEHSIIMCHYAMMIAKKFNAEIKLIHAYENPVINSSPYIEPVVYAVEPLNQLSALLTDSKRKMTGLKKELIKIWPEAKLTYSLIKDTPVEGIIQASIDYKPGLIFIGHHLHESLPNSMISHIARKVAAKTIIPVLVIPGNITVRNWIGINKVLYATDLDEQDLISVTVLAEMMKPLNIEVHCVHVSIGTINPIIRARFDLMKKEMQSRNIRLRNVVYKLIVGDDVENTLETYLRNNTIGLISMTPHKRNLLSQWLTPSLTNRIVKHSDIPVLLLHD
jgi:nucleotide-binding universal stress UspA family protein